MFTSSPSPEGLIWQRHLMWDVRNTWAPQVENCSPSHSFIPCLQYKRPLMPSFSVSFFPFLEFCLTACLKLPLLKGRANTLVSKLRCHYTGGDLSLGFSKDHSSLLGLSIKLCNTLFENRVAEGVPYLLCRDTYGMETGVFFLFPPTPLTMVPVGFWGREKLEMHFLHSFCWNLWAG